MPCPANLARLVPVLTSVECPPSLGTASATVTYLVMDTDLPPMSVAVKVTAWVP